MRPLSISNSKKVFFGTLGFLALFNVIATLAYRQFKHKVPSPYFARHDPALKHELLRKTLESGYTPNLLFMGSSVAFFGFNVDAFDKETADPKVRPLNFGINGTGPGVFLKILKHMILTDFKIDTLVYGISPIEINSGSSVFKSDQENMLGSLYFQAERDDLWVKASLKRFLFDNIALVKWRDILAPALSSNPPEWKAKFSEVVKARGWYEAREGHWEDKAYREGRMVNQNWRIENLLGNYDVQGSLSQEMGMLMEFCKEQGIQMVLVDMPVLKDRELLKETAYDSLFEGKAGATKLDRYQARLVELTTEHQIPFLAIGPSGDYQSRDFLDPFHLHAEATPKFAGQVAEFLKKVKAARQLTVKR